MANIDFIIHPTNAQEMYSDSTIFQSKKEIYEQYLSELENIVEKSEHPVLIETPKQQDNYFCDIPVENILISEYYSDEQNKHLYIFGFIHDESWGEFTKIIKDNNITKDSKIRIHGSYIDACLPQFARQLTMYLALGMHTNNFDNGYLRHVFDEKIIIPIAENIGIFARTNIRYGVTLSQNVIADDIIFSPQKPWITKPFGSFEYQLCDDKTEIFK